MRILTELREGLTVAMRGGDRTTASMIRTLIGALENAGAVEVGATNEPKTGLGHDVPRRELDDEEIRRVVERERAEVVAAIEHYRELGLDRELEDLRRRLAVVDEYAGRIP